MLTEILLFILIVLISYVIWRRYRIFTLRERLGLKGPKANFLTGNLSDIVFSPYKDRPMQILSDWCRKYGTVFGYYFGPKLTIYITDMEMIKEVLIKRFDSFVDRRIFVLDEPPPNCFSLVNLNGDHWKHIRSIITPTFTASKMKQMSHIINEKIDIFMNKMGKFADEGKSFEIHSEFQALTLDVIAQCAFAVNADCQTNPKDSFLVYAREAFKLRDMRNFPLLAFAAIIPELRWLWSKLRLFSRMEVVDKILQKNLLSVVLDRKQNTRPNQRVDVLQFLLQQQKEEQIDGKSKQWQLTDDVIVGNAFVFLLAGYETTSTALGFTTWLLAKHKNVQEKLQAEIDDNLWKNCDKNAQNQVQVDYSFVNNMAYMDAVFHESLRVLPPVIHFVQRYCVKDCRIGSLFIPRGVQVHIPIPDVHMNPDLWNDPEKYDPERFLNNSSNSNVSWLPFGAGPRSCVGMRFADMEYKMALIRLLSQYTIELADKSEESLKICENAVAQRPKNGVNVKLIKRNINM